MQDMCKMLTVHVQYRLCMNKSTPQQGHRRPYIQYTCSRYRTCKSSGEAREGLSWSWESQRGGNLFYIFHSTLRWCVGVRERASSVCSYKVQYVCTYITYILYSRCAPWQLYSCYGATWLYVHTYVRTMLGNIIGYLFTKADCIHILYTQIHTVPILRSHCMPPGSTMALHMP